MTSFFCSGQGVFTMNYHADMYRQWRHLYKLHTSIAVVRECLQIKNNADMYRLWRYLSQIGERTNFAWIHGFRTNVHNGFVSLDDYDGKNSYAWVNCL